MKYQEFEKICRESRFRILPKKQTPDGHILLAERETSHPVYPKPFYETLWAIDRDECDFAQVVRNDKFYKKNELWLMNSREDRIEDAMKSARQWIADNLNAGRY